MDIISLANSIIQYMFFSLYTFYISKRILNFNNLTSLNAIICIVTSIFLGIIFGMLSNALPTFIIILFIISIIASIISLIIKTNIFHTIFITSISMSLNLLFFSIALFFISLPTVFPQIYYIYHLELLRTFLYVVLFSIELFIIHSFFKISRLKERNFFH